MIQITYTKDLTDSPEDQLPPERDYLALFMVIFGFLFFLSIIGLSLVAPSPDHKVSFSLAIQGYTLAPVSKAMNITVLATGKQYIPPTTAIGTITFYNGAIYTQIIPINTILKGADGLSVITDAQAVIPPSAQTIPPTYGQTSVLAHSMTPGASGNIQAGDINQACCVTSVIAQNPYGFHGGRDAYTYTYLTSQNVKSATASILPILETQTLSLFSTSIVLHLHCATVLSSHPSVGQQATAAIATLRVTCNAVSYTQKAIATAIDAYKQKLGSGTLSHIQFQVVEIKGNVIRVYVTAIFNPIVVGHFAVK